MIDLKAYQKRIYENKVNKNFNITDIHYEFCRTYGELAEAFEAYHKNLDTLGEELADVTIYLLGMAEILGIDLESEIKRKVEINEQREYIQINGVNYKKEEK